VHLIFKLGVPQWLVLGPLFLFKTKLFADDGKVKLVINVQIIIFFFEINTIFLFLSKIL